MSDKISDAKAAAAKFRDNQNFLQVLEGLEAAEEAVVVLTACFFALGRAGANVADGPFRKEWVAAQEVLNNIYRVVVPR